MPSGTVTPEGSLPPGPDAWYYIEKIGTGSCAQVAGTLTVHFSTHSESGIRRVIGHIQVECSATGTWTIPFNSNPNYIKANVHNGKRISIIVL
ncbi:hypothetical protein GCM10010470_12860 [Saccharopolyspora taberi]|uniref:Uncharacterized protein n=1 Tax=Saccharopolyspora taberi TaxID=60895 RepID=A0ABN3V6J8_9PSEU